MGYPNHDDERDAQKREPRERLESSKRPIGGRLLRGSDPAGHSSYRIQDDERIDRVEIPDVMTPGSRGGTLHPPPADTTIEQRAPRSVRQRHITSRSNVSQSLATAQAVAQRVIDRAAATHRGETQALGRGGEVPQTTAAGEAFRAAVEPSLRQPRRRAETIAGLGLPPTDDEDDNA